jgi:hypothetical protein
MPRWTKVKTKKLMLLGNKSSGYNDALLSIGGERTLAYGGLTNSVSTERIDITGAITGGNYWFGRYVTMAMSATMPADFIMGHYVKITVGYIGYEIYGIRGRISVTAAQTGNAANQFIGVYGYVDVASGTHALLASGGFYGVLGQVSLAGGTSDQPLIGVYASTYSPSSNSSNESTCFKGLMEDGYCQTGLSIHNRAWGAEFIRLSAGGDSTLDYGIFFEHWASDAGGTCTYAFGWENATGLGLAANTATLTLAPTSHHIAVWAGGAAGYIPVFDNTSWT